MKEKYIILTTIIILSLLLILYSTVSTSFLLANSSQGPFPVLLIHGYFSNSSVWKTWEELLRKDGITATAANFTLDDECGSAEEHALELNQIVENLKNKTGAERINIVAHSKGGLDARVYLANGLSNDDIANLIMIGTPNAGSPLANLNNMCRPAIYDLRPGSPVSTVKMNNNTRYYTIAGNWTDSSKSPNTNCSPENKIWLDFQKFGSSVLIGPNDGIVPLSSVQSGGFNSLGSTNNCHTDLLGEEEYKIARQILFG